MSRIDKSTEIENRLVVATGEWEVTANRYRVSFGDDEIFLELQSSNTCTTL